VSSAEADPRNAVDVCQPVLHLSIDKDVCEGHGVCWLVAAELVGAGVDGLGEVLKPQIGSSERTRAEEAIEGCPTLAIALREEASREG
jgi:ferredoxin